jgi:hypothetical protein
MLLSTIIVYTLGINDLKFPINCCEKDTNIADIIISLTHKLMATIEKFFVWYIHLFKVELIKHEIIKSLKKDNRNIIYSLSFNFLTLFVDFLKGLQQFLNCRMIHFRNNISNLNLNLILIWLIFNLDQIEFVLWSMVFYNEIILIIKLFNFIECFYFFEFLDK